MRVVMKIFCVLLFFVFGGVLSACGITEKSITGNGKVETRFFDKKNFTKVELSGSMTAEIINGTEFKIQISADENLYEYMSIDKIQDTLKIRTEKRSVIKKFTEYKVIITMPIVHECTIYGACKVFINNFDDSNAKLLLHSSGASTICLSSMFKTIEVTQYGAGKFILSGKSAFLKYSSFGNGILYASDLEAEKVYLLWRGSGYAEVYAIEKLDIDISGGGYIKYKGEPEINRSLLRGAVKVTRMN